MIFVQVSAAAGLLSSCPVRGGLCFEEYRCARGTDIMSAVPSVHLKTCLYENILRISPVVCVQSICHAAGPAASLCKNLLMIHGPPERSTDLRTCSPTIRRTWRLPCGRNKFYIHPADRSILCSRSREVKMMQKPCQSAVVRWGWVGM